ncbi:MAG: hypothetical protein F7C82_04130 [Desulfurococcales archaeon]|nr:hypothetical protein [Desulfurococcales archaeon]
MARPLGNTYLAVIEGARIPGGHPNHAADYGAVNPQAIPIIDYEPRV